MIADPTLLTIINNNKKEGEKIEEKERNNWFRTYATTVSFGSYCQDRK
jgi:hypothetical protein